MTNNLIKAPQSTSLEILGLNGWHDFSDVLVQAKARGMSFDEMSDKIFPEQNKIEYLAQLDAWRRNWRGRKLNPLDPKVIETKLSERMQLRQCYENASLPFSWHSSQFIKYENGKAVAAAIISAPNQHITSNEYTPHVMHVFIPENKNKINNWESCLMSLKDFFFKYYTNPEKNRSGIVPKYFTIMLPGGTYIPEEMKSLFNFKHETVTFGDDNFPFSRTNTMIKGDKIEYYTFGLAEDIETNSVKLLGNN